MKKVIAILLVLGTAFALWASYSSLEKKAQLQRDPIEAVPKNAALFLESKNIKQLWSQLAETNLIWSELLNISTFNTIDQNIRFVDSILSGNEQLKGLLENTNTVVSIHPEGEEFAINTVAICDENQFKAIQNQLNSSNANIENTPSKGRSIQSFKANGNRYYFYHLNPFLLFSTSLSSIQNAIDQVTVPNAENLNDNKDFRKLSETTSEFASGHIYFNNEQLIATLQPYLTKEAVGKWRNANLPKMMMADLNIKSNALVIVGLSTFTNTLNPEKQIAAKHISNLLPDHIEYLSKQKIGQLLQPENIDERSLKSTSEICECDPIQTLNGIVDDEIVHVRFSKNFETQRPFDLILFPISGNENILGPMTQLGVGDTIIAEQYETPIYQVNEPEFIKLLFPSINPNNFYFATSNDYALIGNKRAIGKILYKWNKQNNVISDSKFLRFQEDYMAKYTNSDLYTKPVYLINNLKSFLKKEYQSSISSNEETIKKITDFAWQSSSSNDSLTFQSFVIAVNNNANTSSDGTLWQTTLKSPIISTPQLMKNHRTNTLEILVEDSSHVIHLIGATGKVKWSKPLNERIIGEIKQIDIYNNGKWQMLFSTENRIHLLDINGNEVKGFPIKLPEQATNGVGIFDYDNDKNYRFAIATIDKKVRLYDKDGATVKGWSTPTTKALVVDQLRHFRIDGKDYIFTTDISGNTYFWERKGTVRFNLKKQFFTPYKDNISFDKSFTLSTSRIHYLDSNYNTCSLRFNDSISCFAFNPEKDKITYLTDLNKDGFTDFVTAYENRFEVYGLDQSVLFFETMSFPTKNALFIINGQKGDKYIGLVYEGELWMYNNRFQLLQNMPIKGSKFTTAGDLNKDGKLNVVTILDGNTVVVYEIDNLQL